MGATFLMGAGGITLIDFELDVSPESFLSYAIHPTMGGFIDRVANIYHGIGFRTRQRFRRLGWTFVVHLTGRLLICGARVFGYPVQSPTIAKSLSMCNYLAVPVFASMMDGSRLEFLGERLSETIRKN